MKVPEGIIDNESGFFLFTQDGVFKYNSDDNCFKEVEICNSDGVVIQKIGGITQDPKNED